MCLLFAVAHGLNAIFACVGGMGAGDADVTRRTPIAWGACEDVGRRQHFVWQRNNSEEKPSVGHRILGLELNSSEQRYAIAPAENVSLNQTSNFWSFDHLIRTINQIRQFVWFADTTGSEIGHQHITADKNNVAFKTHLSLAKCKQLRSTAALDCLTAQQMAHDNT